MIVHHNRLRFALGRAAILRDFSCREASAVKHSAGCAERDAKRWMIDDLSDKGAILYGMNVGMFMDDRGGGAHRSPSCSQHHYVRREINLCACLKSLRETSSPERSRCGE